ncbi:MAG: hypothetical protein GF409_07790 [Candidatus Omnitrophica bacterium]|nr:hypothetical protein [Candidatus Omnitrophota bacterium]
MKKLMVIVLSLAFILAAMPAQNVFAKWSECPDDKVDLDDKVFKKAKFLLMYEDELGLSDGQIKQIKDIKVKAKKYLIDKKAEIYKIKVDIKDAMYEDDIDTGKINKLIDKKYDIKKEKAKYLVNSYVLLKNTLNDDQKEKAKDIWMGMYKEGGYMHKARGMMHSGKHMR